MIDLFNPLFCAESVHVLPVLTHEYTSAEALPVANITGTNIPPIPPK
jgi:hypothetical protein